MVEPLRPVKGGFLRPFGCGWFVREYLAGNGPEGSTKIDPIRGATQSDICFEYKETLAKITARERAERIISDNVVKKVDVTEEEADKIYQRELKKVSRKFSHMSFATACELHHITQMEELSIFTQAHGDNKKSLCYLRRNHILGNKFDFCYSDFFLWLAPFSG